MRPKSKQGFCATGKKITVINQGMVRQKYVKFMGETRSIHFRRRTEMRKSYGIHRIWFRMTLKISEIRCVDVRWVDMAKYRSYCRTL